MRLAAPILGALVLAGCGGAPAQHAEHPPFTPMSEPAHAAAPGGRWLTARLTSPTALRARPGGRALARLGVRTEFGSRRVLSVTARRAGWLAVVTPERPNGRVGWIPERRARLARTHWSIVVERSARRLTLRRGAPGHAAPRPPRPASLPRRRRPAGHADAGGPLRDHGQAAPPGRLALRLLRARPHGPPDEAPRGLAGRRPARDPRHAAGGDRWPRRVVGVHARADARRPPAHAHRPGRDPGVRARLVATADASPEAPRRARGRPRPAART